MAPTATSPVSFDRTKKDPRPIPKVPDLDCESYASEDALLHDIIEGIKVAGLCIVRHIIKPDILAKIGEEMKPYMSQPLSTPGDFWPQETQKIASIISKSETYALHLVGNPIWQKTGEYFLTSTMKDYWVMSPAHLTFEYPANQHPPLQNGQEITTSVSKPQLNDCQAFVIGPGARDQGLHRDDIVYQNHQPYTPTHTLGRDLGIGFFVAHTPTTRENGATRFIPGSHLWDYDILPNESLAIQPELQPGDSVMMLSGVYHGGSKNTTGGSRVVWTTHTTRGWIRQEENQYLCNDVEKIKKLPLWLQMFCGWSMSKPFMGWVDLDDPIKLLHPDLKLEGDPYY